jgi:8-oxo-dGTP pyrophosphatase MutT (NUDIX family)
MPFMVRTLKKTPSKRPTVKAERIMKPRAVAAICLVWKSPAKQEVALIKRRDDHPHHLSGRWFFPGGGVALEEQPLQAALRETMEECGISVRNAQLLDTYAYTEHWEDGALYSQPVVLSVYEALHDDGDLRVVEECTDARWIPLKEIGRFITPDTAASHLSDIIRSVLKLS